MDAAHQLLLAATFPANATLQVAHRYTPAFGSAFFYKGLLND